MKLMRNIAAGVFALAGSCLISGFASAAPLSIPGDGGKGLFSQPGQSLVQKVYGCHKFPQNHMVYLWGYPAWHRHSGPGCQPVPATPPGPPGYGPPGFVPPGYGGGYNCHGNWQNHFHPGWGGGWHRHSSRTCQPRRGRKWKGGSKKGCLNIAGIWICP